MRLWWIVALALALVPGAAQAQQGASAAGRWLTEDGAGVIEIYPCGEELCGRIVWLAESLDSDGKPLTDKQNPNDALKTRPICGLDMLGGFKPAGANEWNDGWIYSPENGKTYSAQMTLESATVLKLRGYVGIPLFGETQTWTRADPHLSSCQAVG